MRMDEAEAFPHSEVEAARSAVRQAWRTVLGRRSLSQKLTLADAGCDSLCLLQFAFVIEKALKRAVPLDMICNEMHPDDVVAALCGGETGRSLEDVRPTVFLMPGLDDDEQRLARFRVGLQQRVRFILAEYPDWPEMLRPNWGFPDLVDAVVRQIVSRSAGTPVLLTGYSFGGEVAFATACRLIEVGCPVRWLGILDTDFTSVPPPLSGGLVTRLRRYVGEIAPGRPNDRLHRSLGLFLAKLARQGPGLRYVHRTAPWWRAILPSRTQFWFDRRTRSILRMRALWARSDSATPGTLAAPVTLFRSEARGSLSPPDLGWRSRCPMLSIVPVPGDHHTLFDPPHRDVLYTRYAEVVEGTAAHS